MDRSVSLRLDAASPHYDSELYNRLGKLASDYIRNGLQVQAYFLPDFDAANDVANALAAVEVGTTVATFDKIDRSSSRNFSHPCGATQITVLATAMSQILFGGETNRRVEARNPEDETKADATNQLLAWNDQQNESYADGYLWTLDTIIFNRGIQYDYWKDQYETRKEPVTYEIPYIPEVDPKTRRKLPKPVDYKPEKVTRWKTVRKKVGGYCKIVNISPYDFISDPTIPFGRFQESRYAGHRVLLSWQELERRSKLPSDDYEYVLPAVVKKLKNAKTRKVIAATSTGGNAISTSRSFFERQRRGNPTPDIGMTDKVNKEDGGTVECWLITIRYRPKTYELFSDDEEELIQHLIAGETDLLSVNVMDNEHGDYPYAVGEARPNAHMQFSPSWALLMKPSQDYMDLLKGAHAENVERNGSIFLGDGTKCDAAQVLGDKTRVRQLVLKTEEAGNTPNDQILEQIKMDDPTKDFPKEMQMWEQIMEKTSGAQPNVQGSTDDPSQTLGQYQDVAQMAMGRLSTMARNLSSRALMRQIRRIVMNFQQWAPDRQTIRITGKNGDYDPDSPPEKFLTIRRDPMSDEEKKEINAEYDKACQEAISQGLQPPPMPEAVEPDIQFEFDVVPHDGAMPGTDARAVAAASRLIEAAANPAFQQCFDTTIPGNYDPRALIAYVAEKTGMPVNNFRISRETAMKNLQARQLAAGGGITPPQQPVQAPQGPPAPLDSTGQPSAAVLPPNPSAEPPGAQGMTLTI